MEGNLTRGPILKTLTKLAIPIMASSFLGTLYNITDMAWIGLLGAKAVAGVGVGGMFTWLSQGLASMARMGGQVQVAQCIGRGERQKAHGFAQTAMQLALLMGLAYGIIGALFANPLVGFFRLEDAETLRAALDYTRIVCGFIVFSFLSVTLTGIYTAQGDSKTPFVANLFGLAANMILDPVLILGPGPFPRFGAAGAAMATVLAQVIVSGIMLLGIFVQKKDNVLKGLRLFVKIPLEYVEENRNSYGASGYGVLFHFHDFDAHGGRLWPGGDCYAAGRRSDRINLMEFGGRIWCSYECFYRSELWRR